MTEEINFSYEGGLYGELIRNRSFKADPTNAVFWDAVGGAEPLTLDTVDAAERRAGREPAVEASMRRPPKIPRQASCERRLLGNPGATQYDISFIVLCQGRQFSGPLTVAILESADGKSVFATAAGFRNLTGDWKNLSVN
jgi:alpha-L-arabinofuranosidase